MLHPGSLSSHFYCSNTHQMERPPLGSEGCVTLCLGSIAPRMEAPIPGTHRLNWAPLSPKRRGLVHSARKEDHLERVTSSSLRENRLELLGSDCWSLSPPSLLPSNPHLTSCVSLSPRPTSVCLSSCLCPFLCLSFSVSRALLPSPPPHPPFSWREVCRYQFLRHGSAPPALGPLHVLF